MSQTTGKTSTYIKNANVKESTQIQTGFKNTRFLHQATAGQTLIQLTSLTTPTGVVNYSAPSVSDLSKTNLMQWGDNFRLTSSVAGILIQNVSYVITGASSIKLLYSALDGEIFEGVIDHQARTAMTLVDATPLVQSGTLAAGDTDFNVGSPFQVGLYSSTSHGAVLVYVDGQLMQRNTGNNPMGAGVSGHYYEVHSGNGLGQIIRFNSPDLINDRAVSVVSVGSLVERPNGSLMAVMESVQGQIDALVPTVAALADVAETTFQATPNNVDLKSFGDRVITLEKILDLPIPNMSGWINAGSFQIGATTTAPTYGTATITTNTIWYRQVGDSAEIRWEFQKTANGTATAGSGQYLFPMPAGLVIDVNKLKADTAVTVANQANPQDNTVGHFAVFTTAASFVGGVTVYDANNVKCQGSDTVVNNASIGGISSGFAAITNAAIGYGITVTVPIVGFTATRTVRQALGL
jgi:hypothetical protein